MREDKFQQYKCKQNEQITTTTTAANNPYGVINTAHNSKAKINLTRCIQTKKKAKHVKLEFLLQTNENVRKVNKILLHLYISCFLFYEYNKN